MWSEIHGSTLLCMCVCHRLVCTVCNRDFRSLPALNGHMRSHSGSRLVTGSNKVKHRTRFSRRGGFTKSLPSKFSLFFSLSRVRPPPSRCHAPSPHPFNPLARPRRARADRGCAAARFRPPGTWRSTIACCTNRERPAKTGWNTTPLRPCCALSGRDQGCTAPSPPGGSREHAPCSFAMHQVTH